MSPSVHVDKKKKDISILGEYPTQWLDDTTLTAEKKYSINFTRNRNIFFNLHYNEPHSYLFAHGVEIVKFKGNDFEINEIQLCPGNV